MGLELIVGIAAFCIILLAVVLANQKAHPVYALAAILVIISIMPLLAKASMDARESCTPVVNSSTTNSTINVTSYTYIDHCVTSKSNTAVTFFKGAEFVRNATFVYVFVWLNWWFWLDRVGKILTLKGGKPRIKRR